MKLCEVKIGRTEQIRHKVTEADVELFASTSGDTNPLHLDEAYARKSRFGERIAHGMFAANFFSGIFGTKFPGPGCLYVGQSLKFRKPILIGDTIDVSVIVKQVHHRKRVIEFSTKCTVDGTPVITGSADIYIPVEMEDK